MALSKDEREKFLAEPHIAALSVSAGVGSRREHGESVAVYMTPQHWLSSDLGSV